MGEYLRDEVGKSHMILGNKLTVEFSRRHSSEEMYTPLLQNTCAVLWPGYEVLGRVRMYQVLAMQENDDHIYWSIGCFTHVYALHVPIHVLFMSLRLSTVDACYRPCG